MNARSAKAETALQCPFVQTKAPRFRSEQSGVARQEKGTWFNLSIPRMCFSETRKGDMVQSLYFTHVFLGLPRERRVYSRPSCSTIACCHESSPNGHPRLTHRRRASSSSCVCGSFTNSTQSGGRSTGQSLRSTHLACSGDAKCCSRSIVRLAPPCWHATHCAPHIEAPATNEGHSGRESS